VLTERAGNNFLQSPMEDAPDKAPALLVDPWQPIPASDQQPIATLLMPPSDVQRSLDSERYLALIGWLQAVVLKNHNLQYIASTASDAANQHALL
jgi:hypothetical protein